MDRSALQSLASRLGLSASQTLALEEAIADSDGDVCLAASDALSRIRKDLH